MNKKILIAIILGVIIGISGILLVAFYSASEPVILSFTYDEGNANLKESLSDRGILMSSPLKLTGESLSKYCTFFDAEIQDDVEYCTSTELKNNEGHFLGNIHMLGTSKNPTIVLGVVQTDPFFSNYADMKNVFLEIIENLVCGCWDEQKPGMFDSVSSWLDAARDHHLEGKRTTSVSEISGLGGKQLLLEITTNQDGYLWKLVVRN